MRKKSISSHIEKNFGKDKSVLHEIALPDTVVTHVNLGFTVADGERVRLLYIEDDYTLIVCFTDLEDEEVCFMCSNTLAFQWQRAEYFLSNEERDDSAYEVCDSAWLRIHREQGYAYHNHRHFKLNFNAAGILEILCAKIERVKSPPKKVGRIIKL